MTDLRSVQWWGWFGEWYDIHFSGWTLGEKPELKYGWVTKHASLPWWAVTSPTTAPWSGVLPASPDWYAQPPMEVEDTVD